MSSLKPLYILIIWYSVGESMYVYRENVAVLVISSSVMKVVQTPDILIPLSEIDVNTDLKVGRLEGV